MFYNLEQMEKSYQNLIIQQGFLNLYFFSLYFFCQNLLYAKITFLLRQRISISDYQKCLQMEEKKPKYEANKRVLLVAKPNYWKPPPASFVQREVSEKHFIGKVTIFCPLPPLLLFLRFLLNSNILQITLGRDF